MSITIEKYERVPFYVEAVQVTAQNMEDAAKWCGGELKHETRQGRRIVRFIEVEVSNPLSDKQKRAYAGNWVLKGGTGAKVYTDKAFQGCFRKVLPAPTPEEIWTDDMLPLAKAVGEWTDEGIHHNDIAVGPGPFNR